jgi:hypothetical protein
MSNQGDPGTAVLEYARKQRGKKVGNGSCWDLAHKALTEGAHAKSAPDYGLVSDTSDDRWGKPVDLEDALPGDILQFKDHKAIVTRIKKTRITLPDGSWLEYEESDYHEYTRGHHTAIVASSLDDGKITVLEQHVKRGGHAVEETVGDGTIYVSNSNPEPQKSRESILITKAWGHKVQAYSKDKALKAQVDSIVKSYHGKFIGADVVTTETISVSGTIKAYRPEPRK